MHHRRARISLLRARHDPLFRGEFAAATSGSRLATIVAITGIETASIVLTLWQERSAKAVRPPIV
jgi:hypothetical protein